MKITIEVSDEIADVIQAKLGLDVETMVREFAKNVTLIFQEFALAHDAGVKLSQEKVNQICFEIGMSVAREAREAKTRQDEQQART